MELVSLQPTGLLNLQSTSSYSSANQRSFTASRKTVSNDEPILNCGAVWDPQAYGITPTFCNDQAPSNRKANNPPQACGICWVLFSNGKLLEEHAVKWDHNTFVCAETGCGLAYRRRDSLSRHEAIHTRYHEQFRISHTSLQRCDRRLRRRQHRRKQNLMSVPMNSTDPLGESLINSNIPLLPMSHVDWSKHVDDIATTLAGLVVKMIKTEVDVEVRPTDQKARLAKDLAGLVVKGGSEASPETIARLEGSIQNLNLEIIEGTCCESKRV